MKIQDEFLPENKKYGLLYSFDLTCFDEIEISNNELTETSPAAARISISCAASTETLLVGDSKRSGESGCGRTEDV